MDTLTERWDHVRVLPRDARVTEEMATKVETEVGKAPVAGLVAHVSGPTATGWRIIDVWESEEDYHRFVDERLNPALQVATRGQTPPSRPFDFLSRHQRQRAGPARASSRGSRADTRALTLIGSPHNLGWPDHSFRQHFIQDSR